MNSTEKISEDGRTLTVFTEDDDSSIKEDDGNDGHADTGDDSIDALVNFDVSKVPDEHRPMFDQLVDAIKQQKLSIENLKTRSDFADVMRTMLETSKSSAQTDKDKEPPKREKLADKLKFADDDYYAPFFKMMAEAFDNLTDNISGFARNVENETEQAFKDRVGQYIQDNGVSKEVLAKMDELASTLGNPKLGYRNPAFRDLTKLHRLACSELGVSFKKGEKSSEKKKDDNPPKRKPNDPKKRIEMNSSRRTESEPKKITSMKDAFEKAKEDLASR
jgi:hypothetical protein